eukprot:541265-Rhodomonas_salina.4
MHRTAYLYRNRCTSSCPLDLPPSSRPLNHPRWSSFPFYVSPSSPAPCWSGFAGRKSERVGMDVMESGHLHIRMPHSSSMDGFLFLQGT